MKCPECGSTDVRELNGGVKIYDWNEISWGCNNCRILWTHGDVKE